MIKHLLEDYPPRSTACGLYYPKNLFVKGFGTYTVKGVTCKRCLRYLTRAESSGGKKRV